MTRAPEVARGGPWVKPTLPDGALVEAASVAKLRSFQPLFAQAEATAGSFLKGLSFTPAAELPWWAQVVRGGSVTRKKRSGTTGLRHQILPLHTLMASAQAAEATRRRLVRQQTNI